MKLTVTQRDLLERAAKHPHGVVSVISGHVTSRKQGQNRYGTRERDAAHKLLELGFFKHVDTHKSVHHLSHGFGADHGSDSVFEITDNGRIMINEPPTRDDADMFSDEALGWKRRKE